MQLKATAKPTITRPMMDSRRLLNTTLLTKTCCWPMFTKSRLIRTKFKTDLVVEAQLYIMGQLRLQIHEPTTSRRSGIRILWCSQWSGADLSETVQERVHQEAHRRSRKKEVDIQKLKNFRLIREHQNLWNQLMHQSCKVTWTRI